MVNLNPINPELMTERIMDTLPLKVGSCWPHGYCRWKAGFFTCCLRTGRSLGQGLMRNLNCSREKKWYSR